VSEKLRPTPPPIDTKALRVYASAAQHGMTGSAIARGLNLAADEIDTLRAASRRASVEEVARAIWNADGKNAAWDAREAYEDGRGNYLDLARAVLAALSPPPPEDVT